ncbi:MAG: hypothetical protein AAF845_19435 [Bacteroidota bacterium]
MEGTAAGDAPCVWCHPRTHLLSALVRVAIPATASGAHGCAGPEAAALAR